MLDFDLVEAVESTLDLLTGTAHGKRIELACEIGSGLPAGLRGDAGRLRQILTNLVSNAIKFTEQGEVVIRVSLAAQTESHVTLRFEVRDTGIGISPAAQSNLFQPFSQADGSTTRKYGGTGLGLAIAKHLVTIMEGHIGMESEANKGSTFWFTAKLEKQLGPAVSRKSHLLPGFRVLVVDDYATNRQILHHQLLAWEIQPECVASGEDALKMMREAVSSRRPCGLVLLDNQMPGMDGPTLARTIKSEPTLEATRLVMLTSNGQLLSPRELQEYGIDSCIIKPVKQARLLDCITESMDRRTPQAKPPAEPVTYHPAAPASRLPQSLMSLRILLADNNQTNRTVALAQLGKLGYAAEAVANGRQVMAALEQGSYDVILMDCQMPELDGYQAAQTIRQRKRTSGADCPWKVPVHIIAMTAHAVQGDREKCLAAGMDDYLSKPVRAVQLKIVLERPRQRA